MPELPEVETVRRQLEPFLAGKTIIGISVPDPAVVAPLSPQAFGRRLRGEKIKAVSRRGKYLRLELDGGGMLVIHLRMTGVLSFVQKDDKKPEKRFLRLKLCFSNGGCLYFRDQRRFGTARILACGEAGSFFVRLGPEPLARSFTPDVLKRLLDSRKRPLKSFLLDQSIIAGIGNIYADEALFRAGLHPLRPAGSLSAAEAGRLSRAIKETLREAISLAGSSVDTYRDTRGRRGRFQETFRVHRRVGEPCPGCGGTVKKIRVGGRGTFFCPSCQA